MRRATLMFVGLIALVVILYVAPIIAEGTESLIDNSPYEEPTVTLSPHGGYTSMTNKCKVCHATHRAQGTYKLTRADTRAEVCDYCHGDGAGAGTDILMNREGHTMGYVGASPDDEDGAVFMTNSIDPFDCMDCHSVHGATQWVVVLADISKNFLLMSNPDGFGTSLTASNTLAEWCADCHSANLGSHETTRLVGGRIVYSHDSSATTTAFTGVVSPGDGINNGPTCRQCHASSAFPHGQGGTGRDLLKDSFDGVNLDDVCNDCHETASLP